MLQLQANQMNHYAAAGYTQYRPNRRNSFMVAMKMLASLDLMYEVHMNLDTVMQRERHDEQKTAVLQVVKRHMQLFVQHLDVPFGDQLAQRESLDVRHDSPEQIDSGSEHTLLSVQNQPVVSQHSAPSLPTLLAITYPMHEENTEQERETPPCDRTIRSLVRWLPPHEDEDTQDDWENIMHPISKMGDASIVMRSIPRYFLTIPGMNPCDLTGVPVYCVRMMWDQLSNEANAHKTFTL